MRYKGKNLLVGFVVATIAIMSFSGEESVADVEPDKSVGVSEYMDTRDTLKDSVVELNGGVSCISYTDTGISLVLDKRVSCYFRGDEANRVMGVKINDCVTVKGVSTTNCDGMPELNNCSIK